MKRILLILILALLLSACASMPTCLKPWFPTKRDYTLREWSCACGGSLQYVGTQMMAQEMAFDREVRVYECFECGAVHFK